MCRVGYELVTIYHEQFSMLHYVFPTFFTHIFYLAYSSICENYISALKAYAQAKCVTVKCCKPSIHCHLLKKMKS